MMMSLPKFIPLSKAANELGLTETELRARVEAGTIAAGVLPNGEIVVSEENIENGYDTVDINSRLQAISRKEFHHLDGTEISVPDASQKYKIGYHTIAAWVRKGYIQVIDSGYGKQIDEGDVAFCVAVYKLRKKSGIRSGIPLLDEQGYPYLLKHPALSRYRHERRYAD